MLVYQRVPFISLPTFPAILVSFEMSGCWYFHQKSRALLSFTGFPFSLSLSRPFRMQSVYCGQHKVINQPSGNGNHTTYKNGDDWGMVYYCFNHVTVQVDENMILYQICHHPISSEFPMRQNQQPLALIIRPCAPRHWMHCERERTALSHRSIPLHHGRPSFFHVNGRYHKT